MKLIHDLIIRRLEVSKDLELNIEHFKAIWHFYEVYKLSINILGITDSNLKKKMVLIKNLILNPDNPIILNKLKEYMSQDSKTVEIALYSLEETENIEEVYEDLYPQSIFAVNIDDRGN